MELAPIVLFVYNREDNVKGTIEALKSNTQSSNSNLYIFSDGPKNEQDGEKVKKVREYIETISGFKNIEIIKSEKNKGLAKSVIEGVSFVLNKYDKVIVLEDDIVTSRTFLEFMNNCLECYSQRNDIWSISGYSPTISIPNNFNDEVFINIRGASWGWATWRDRWNEIDWSIPNAKEFLKNSDNVKKFNNAGNDLSRMLYEYLNNRIDSWAIRWYYTQFIKNKYTVYPVKSLINNSGFGDGTHGANKRLAEELNTKAEEFLPKLNVNIKTNKDIDANIKELYDINLFRRLVFLLRKYGFYWLIKKVKKLKSKKY